MKHNKMNNEESKKYEPIIFMNSPISTEENDAIGISSAVDSIKMAIEAGAKMIGIVAEYGSGKSSITEMLAADEKYKEPIYINMWDSIQDNVKDENQITNLTKSFIYQLAMGKSSQTANHVNKMLSKNYNIVSFSIGMKKFWIYAILATIFVAMFMVLDNITIKTFTDLFGEYTVKANVIGYILLLLKPLFLIGGIILGVLGIKNTNIAYSRWKPENRRDTEINEVFAAYTYVFNKLLDKENSKVVVIEDLDRIGNQESIIGFLKELYRFNNLNIKSKKKKPVFLVSISSETYVRRNESSQCDDEYIYTKIFDYIISLKPLHYDDYQMVLKEIIFSDENKKNKLNELLNEDERIVGDNLPLAFEWLYRGENLTIRELKDRLNKAIALLVNLKNKNYDNNPYISFRTCVCVVYLEQKYPKEFYEITHQEEKFSRLIQETSSLKNSILSDRRNSIVEKIKITFPRNTMTEELAYLIFERVIDMDFRMYFYSFPKGSYIKDIDEKDLCNYLELPYEYKYDANTLDEKIDRVIAKNRFITIKNMIQELGEDSEISRYPKVIFETKRLFEVANKCNANKVLSSLIDVVNFNGEEYVEAARILTKVQTYAECDQLFFEKFAKQILGEFEFWTYEKSEIVQVRKALITIFREKILWFKELFFEVPKSDVDIPIITKEEIEEIKDISLIIQLIDVNKIAQDNYEYIEKVITETKLDDLILVQVINIQNTIISNFSFDNLGDYTYDLLSNNLCTDVKLFSFICKKARDGVFELRKISEYLNELNLLKKLNVYNFPEEYYQEIDQLYLEGEISKDIIDELIKRDLYQTALVYCAKNRCLSDIQFYNLKIVKNILDACEKISEKYPNIIVTIRKEIIKQVDNIRWENYSQLFFGKYSIITLDELKLLDNFTKALSLLNGSKISVANVGYIIEYINSDIRKGEACYKLFDYLFNEKYEDVCTDVDIATEILSNLDLNKVDIESMSREQKDNVIEILNDLLGLYEFDDLFNIMDKLYA